MVGLRIWGLGLRVWGSGLEGFLGEGSLLRNAWLELSQIAGDDAKP